MISIGIFGACDCDYLAHGDRDAGGPNEAGTLDSGDGWDAGRDAGRSADEVWILEETAVELHEPACPVAEGQRLFLRVTAIGRNIGCHQVGPVEASLAVRRHGVVVKAWAWRDLSQEACADITTREDRWVDLGELEQGTWTVEAGASPSEITFEVGPPSGNACADPQIGRGGECERDCDCASERCVIDMTDGTCARLCGDLPCGADLDCLEGRCPTEMRGEDEQCTPTFGPCVSDEHCPPAQECVSDGCVFRSHPDPFAPCRSNRDCAAGWSCVVDEVDLENGECAVRCFTDRTPCPVGSCQALPGIGPSWTCSFLGD